MTDGLFQIGWTTAVLDWTATYGVGDGIGSYAYDGMRVQVWNVGAKPYGRRWKRNDVITCCIDLDGGVMKFYQNGEDLGEAYTGLPRLKRDPYYHDSAVYHPGISMSSGQSCMVNFGAAPMAFPVIGYTTLVALAHGGDRGGCATGPRFLLCRDNSCKDRSPHNLPSDGSGGK